MQLAPGIAMLEISAVILNRTDTIYPTLIWDETSAALIDTGYPGQWPLLRAAITKAGVPIEKLTRVIITHQDLDHIGGLPAVRGELGDKVVVFASVVEKPYVEGERRLVKLTPEAIEQAVESLPPDLPTEVRRAFRAVLENPPRAGVDRTLMHGEVLPVGGGLAVIATAGHTLGHISLYHPASKTLIAGDALRVVDGQVAGPDPRATEDMEVATRSLGGLAGYDIRSVICYHGGLYRESDANLQIAALAAS